MTLKEELAAMKAQSMKKIPEDALPVLMQASKDLAASGIVEQAPKKGETLENFELPNQTGATQSLAALREKGPVVVTFYRGGWCPYCNLQLKSYQQMLPEINAAGASLVAITPELPDASLSTAEKNELKFEVLTDKDAAYARQLKLVFTLPESLRPIYKNFGIDVEAHNGAGKFDLPLAATFVVDTDGKIVYAMVDSDYTVRAEPSEILASLKSLDTATAS